MVRTPTVQTARVAEVVLAGGGGDVRAERRGSLVTLEADLDTDIEVELEIEASSGDLRLVEAEQASSAPSRVRVDDGGMILTAHGPGRSRLVVEAVQVDARLRLTTRVDRQAVAEDWLEPPTNF
jgi:hypothetical protein